MGIWDTLAVQTMQHAGMVKNAAPNLDIAGNILGAAGNMIDGSTNVDNSQPVNQTMKALSGAVKGASALSFLGPIGMAAGAVGGGIFSAIMAGKEEDDRRNNNAVARFSASRSSKPIPSAQDANQYEERTTHLGEKFGIKESGSILENIQMT